VTLDEATTPRGGGLVRLRLDLGYDGTDFSGWAAQPGRRTVQGVLEGTLGTVLRLVEAPRLTVAGRTDAGVHARGQVCHVDLPADVLASVGVDALHRRLVGAAPNDIAVHAVSVAPDGFDARFAASWRRYVYRVTDRPQSVDPLRRHEVLHHRRALDQAAMSAAGALLLGEHDFAAYCRRREGASTVRNLLDVTWTRGSDGVLEAAVRADAFCHSMVRALVGAMLVVGEGRQPATWPAVVLAGRERDPRVAVAPAHGLTLEEVAYPTDSELASRVALTRRFRG
jgi:tRNA pseudouridine38-40 synthase